MGGLARPESDRGLRIWLEISPVVHIGPASHLCMTQEAAQTLISCAESMRSTGWQEHRYGGHDVTEPWSSVLPLSVRVIWGNREEGAFLNLSSAQEWQRLCAKVTALSWAIPIIGQRDSECIFPKKEWTLRKIMISGYFFRLLMGFWVNSETQIPFLFFVMNLRWTLAPLMCGRLPKTCSQTTLASLCRVSSCLARGLETPHFGFQHLGLDVVSM